MATIPMVSLVLFVIIFSEGCHDGSSKSQLSRQFLEAKEKQASVELAAEADSLFRLELPVNVSKTSYVYLLNPSCSFCISKAVSCYKAYLMVDGQSHFPFLFLLREFDTELLEIFLQKENLPSSPLIIPCTGSVDLEDGLFTVEDGQVVGYSDWAL